MSSHHFVTVCVVCVLCAAHTPCSAHTAAASPSSKPTWTSLESSDTLESLPEESWRVERSSDSPDSTSGSSSARTPKEAKQSTRNSPKKYSHSYSEEKASRMTSKSVKTVAEDTSENSPEYLQRLVQISERLGAPSISEKAKNIGTKITQRSRRNVETEDKYFTKKLFETYGDGTSLSIEGFEKLLMNLGLFRLVENVGKNEETSTNGNTGNSSKDGVNKDSSGIGPVDANSISSHKKCLNSRELLSSISKDSSYTETSANSRKTNSSSGKNLPDWLFDRVCPVLIYHLISDTKNEREGCIVTNNNYSPTITARVNEMFVLDEENEEKRNMVQVWVYSSISIVIISLCGLLGVLVIPVMGKTYYHQLLQFLVALAIGTLCGDALIHLLPHAMMPPHMHSHEVTDVLTSEANTEHDHNMNMWKGLTAMIGLIIFFFTEKALAMIAEWRKHRQRKNKLPTRVRVMRETDGANANNVGEKLCKHKYSSYPYCYGEITTETRDNHHDHHNDHERPAPIEEEKPLTSNCNSVSKIITKEESDKSSKDPLKNNLTADEWRIDGEVPLNNGEKTVGLSQIASEGGDESYTVIIREHENKHHGHTHSHGHVHAAPDSMSSVAWMVVMGDGLHNFTDGMAIGAAFAANIAGGFSTAIAVFCHELPHELGDFAVLLKAGMSWRQALFYNLLSSILCLFGMIFGVLLGATPSATSWIFAAAAGMFIYIALVDMIPELSSSHSEEGGSRWECVLQALGLVSGLGIMLIIALYEHDLQHIFSD